MGSDVSNKVATVRKKVADCHSIIYNCKTIHIFLKMISHIIRNFSTTAAFYNLLHETFFSK